MNPEELTVRQLMSALSSAGVDLPPQKMSKAYYVELYRKHISDDDSGAKTSSKTTATTATTTGRKRKVDEADIDANAETEDEADVETEDEPNEDEENVEMEPPKILRTPAASGAKRRRRTRGVDENGGDRSGVTPKTTHQEVTAEKPVEEEEEEEVEFVQETEAVKERTTVKKTSVNIFQSARTPRQTRVQASMSQTVEMQTPSPAAHRVPPHTQFVTPQSTRSVHLRGQQTPRSTVAGRTPVVSFVSRSGGSTRIPISPLTPSQVNPKPRDPVKSFFLNLVTVVVWGLLFLCLFLAMSRRGIDPSTPQGLPYCDTEVGGTMLKLDQSMDNCQACPNFGYCARGRLEECEKPYITRNAICVTDDKTSEVAMTMIDILQKDLSVKAGQYECSPSANMLKGVLLEDATTMLEKKKLHPEGEFEACFERMMSIISESGKSLELAVDEVEVEVEERIPIAVHETKEEVTKKAEAKEEEEVEVVEEKPEETGQEKEEEIEVNTVHQEEDFETVKRVEKKRMIYSTYAQIPILCKVARKVRENITYLASGLGFFLLIFLGNIWKNKVERAKRDKEDLVSMVLTYLKENENYVVTDLREELREQFDDVMDVMSYWPEVEEEVMKDSRVSETVEDDERMWIWVEPSESVEEEQ